jgi:eukaryotic-like serine/threonine-protein kinase
LGDENLCAPNIAAKYAPGVLLLSVEIDPEFAYAYSQLATMPWGTGQPELAAEYSQKAYGLKDRAGEFEKLRITHWYHGLVTGELSRLESIYHTL